MNVIKKIYIHENTEVLYTLDDLTITDYSDISHFKKLSKVNISLLSLIDSKRGFPTFELSYIEIKVSAIEIYKGTSDWFTAPIKVILSLSFNF
jgi:hypothetical protein